MIRSYTEPMRAVTVSARCLRAGRWGAAGLRTLAALAALTAITVWTGPVQARTQTQTPTQTPTGADDSPLARVIVAYRADAPTLREHPWQRGAPPKVGREAIVRRAQALSRRTGLALSAGRAVGDRAQVVAARGIGAAELARRLSADPQVEYAVVDRRRRALQVPGDPLFAQGPALNAQAFTGGPVVGQWYLRAPDEVFRSAADVQAAWIRSTGSTGMVVAVLDTGVLPQHPDLQGQLLPGYDFVDDPLNSFAGANDGDGRDPDATDPGDWITSAENASGPLRGCGVSNSSWHGTKVSGIVAAATNNGLGMAGAVYGAKVLPVRVLGKCGGYDADIAAGMLWAAGIDQPGLPGSATPARVLNLSLGGDGACTRFYQDAIDRVVAERGAVVVAAAGNSVGRAVGTPANCKGVIAVAGLRHAGSKVGFSDLGPEISIAAPGGNCINIGVGEPCLYPLLTTTNTGTRGADPAGYTYSDSYRFTVGTSFATPIVAGASALMLSVRSELTPSEVRRLMQSGARPFPTSGADNGTDPTPVGLCRPPDNNDQLQCYCTTALCGAGMLDAGRAVALAATSPLARPSVLTTSPMAGRNVDLSATGSLPAAGRQITAWTWSVVSGPASLSGAANAAAASLQPSAAGTVVVRLSVTDNTGLSDAAELSLAVAAAPVVPVQPPAPSSGGGGAASVTWLVLLALAAAALRRSNRPCLSHSARRP